MVRMSDVWDRATEFLGDNVSALAPVGLLIALLLAFQQGVTTMREGAAPMTGALLALLALVPAFASLVARLAVLAFAVDGDAGLNGGLALAMRRFWVVFGVFLLLVLAVALLIIPFVALISASGVPWSAFQGGKVDPSVFSNFPGWVAGAMLIYSLVLIIGGLWLGVRLALVSPVVLLENRSIGAFGRSFALTKGLALRLLGVLILIAVVAGVAQIATRTVIGSVLRLALGDGGPLGAASILTILAVSLVGAVFALVGDAFTGKLYVAARAREAGVATEAA